MSRAQDTKLARICQVDLLQSPVADLCELASWRVSISRPLILLNSDLCKLQVLRGELPANPTWRSGPLGDTDHLKPDRGFNVDP